LNGLKEKKKHDNWETSRDKDRYSKAPGEKNDDKSAFGSEKPESPAKKPKLLSSSKDPDYSGDGNHFALSDVLLSHFTLFAYLFLQVEIY
jgi:hypothetical protein